MEAQGITFICVGRVMGNPTFDMNVASTSSGTQVHLSCYKQVITKKKNHTYNIYILLYKYYIIINIIVYVIIIINIIIYSIIYYYI